MNNLKFIILLFVMVLGCRQLRPPNTMLPIVINDHYFKSCDLLEYKKITSNSSIEYIDNGTTRFIFAGVNASSSSIFKLMKSSAAKGIVEIRFLVYSTSGKQRCIRYLFPADGTNVGNKIGEGGGDIYISEEERSKGLLMDILNKEEQAGIIVTKIDPEKKPFKHPVYMLDVQDDVSWGTIVKCIDLIAEKRGSFLLVVNNLKLNGYNAGSNK